MPGVESSVESAAALAGPAHLGRSLLTRPGSAVPEPWSNCERISLRPGEFSAAIGGRLRSAWQTRTRVVIELDGAMPDAAPVWQARWWEFTPGLTMRSEVLAHLLTANAVDARDPQFVHFAPLAAAVQLGAQRCRQAQAGDVITDAGPVWCDGGPLDAFDASDAAASDADGAGLSLPVVPAANLAVGSLASVRRAVPQADLAPDQRAAVGHLGGAACIVAPAGSGKTRVLTERARYLVRDVGIAPDAVCLVAFNVRARREMQERTADLPGIEIRTLNSIALAICNGTGPFARPTRHRRVEVIDEIGVRRRLDDLVQRRRRAMTDQLAPWLEALSASRLGLRDPADVEADFQPDVPDLAAAATKFVDRLSTDGLVDFDHQIIRAIEILLSDTAARAAARRACGVLLVDEFQDLTPAHLLMIRLLAGPRADVFAVGDDDQTIYGYAGASPQWLIDFDKYFPGAARHPLRVNYRCPPPVVDGAVNLLSRNCTRISKHIATPPRDGSFPSGRLRTVNAGAAAAEALRDTVATLLETGVRAGDIAVLTRVNSTLLVPQVVLGEMKVTSDAPLGRGFLERTGVAGALAWLRLAVAPRHALPSGALSDAARRPPRAISPRVIEWIGEQRSIGGLRALAGRLSDERMAIKINEFADDVELLRQRTVDEQLSTQAILQVVRDEMGLGLSLDTRLDASRRSVDRSAHGDDLRALISVAHLHADPASFAAWLASRLSGSGASDMDGFGSDDARRVRDAAATSPAGRSGVRLSTIHKVKGLEWPHVIVYEATVGLMPHRLSDDVEEERRVFHVALTRCSESVTIVCGDPPSPFVDELRKPFTPATQAPPPIASHSSRRGGRKLDQIADQPPQRREPPDDPRGAAVYEALRDWRRQRSEADGVRAFVVFHESTLIEIAHRRPAVRAELLLVPGIGPTKLERYGDDIIAVLARF